ncbi:MAG: pyroglutamyl-peptidase I [Pseudomonadota bacterium]
MVLAHHQPARAIPTILLTGFDAFGGDSVNPSWQVAQALQGKRISGHRVVAAQLPTVFGESLALLLRLVEQHQPAWVVCTGLAGGRNAVSLERIAINLADARIPDNAGAQPKDEPVVPSGPAAYFSSLPVRAMLEALEGEGIAAEISQTAGTFVCNHVFYGLMHHLAGQPGNKPCRGGFIHLPYLPEQSEARGTMPLQTMARALQVALRCALSEGLPD